MKRRTFLLQTGASMAAVALPGMAQTSVAHSVENHSAGRSGASREIVHPGILQTREGLEFMKARILAGDEPWKSAWEGWLAEPVASLDFEPKPVVHVIRGAYGAGEKGGRELSMSTEAATVHVLQWYATGNQAHARKVIEILDAWSGMLADFGENDAMLLAGWTGGAFCNAAEILRATYPKWGEASLQKFKRMLLTVYVPLLKMFYPGANGNWDAAIMFTLLSIGIFCDDRALMDQVYTHFRTGPLNSGITRYVYPSGQCEETTRDQGHVQLGLGYMARTAIAAWNQGEDLFAEADNRLALGYEYTARYMLGQEVPCYGNISPVARGRFGDVYSGVLEHYRYVKHIEMPYTEQASVKALPHSQSVLMFFRGGFGEIAPKSPLPPLAASKITTTAGALEKPSAPAPANAIQVPAGQSIQEALDKLAESGGTISLGAGLHTLSQSLRMPSGVTMAGTGLDCVLFLDPKQRQWEAAIVNAAPDLHGLVLRDFVVEGAEMPVTSRDPNSDVQQRRAKYGPIRGGVIFLADGNSRLRNIRLERLTVRNCTYNAVDLFGAEGIEIVNCNFCTSGGMVPPGHGKNHNLRLNHVSQVTITGTRLTDSMWGHGVEIIFAQDVTIRDCELARNELDGAMIAESHRVIIEGCLAEGNSGAGISQKTWMDKNTGVVLRDNVICNNRVPI